MTTTGRDSTADTLLHLDEVACSVGIASQRREILQDVNVEIRPGEVVGLWGANGAGKTSLLRICVGTLAHRDGVTGSVVRPREGLTYLPQDPMRLLLEFLTVKENLRSQWSQPKAEMSITNALRSFGVGEGTDSGSLYPLELSGGNRQRLGWAAAMAPNTRFTALDEPFAAQDAFWKGALAGKMRDAAKAGQSFLVTAHEPDILVACADRILLLSGNQIEPSTIADQVNIDLSPQERVFGNKLSKMALSYNQTLRDWLFECSLNTTPT